MKKLLGILVLGLLLSGNAYSSESHNFVCQVQKPNGVLEPMKFFFELKKNKLQIDGIKYKLIDKPKTNETSISFTYTDGYINIVSINRSTGTMVEKIYDKANDPKPGLQYYKCEIF